MRISIPLLLFLLSTLSPHLAGAELTIPNIPVFLNSMKKQVKAKIVYPSDNKPDQAYLVLSRDRRLPLSPSEAEALYTLVKGPPSIWMYDEGSDSYPKALSAVPNHGSVTSVMLSADEKEIELVSVDLSYPPGTNAEVHHAALDAELLPVQTFFKSLHLPDNRSRHLFLLQQDLIVSYMRVYPLQYDQRTQQVTFVTHADLIAYLAGTSKGLTTYTGPPGSLMGINREYFARYSAVLARTEKDPQPLNFPPDFDSPMEILKLTDAIMNGTASPLDRARLRHVHQSIEDNQRFREILEGKGQESLKPKAREMLAAIHRTEIHPPSSLKSPDDRLTWLNTEFIDDLTCAGATIRVGLHLNASSP